MVRSALADEPGPARDILRLNAGAAIYVSGVVSDLKEGVAQATAAIASGKAAEKLDDLVRLSREL